MLRILQFARTLGKARPARRTRRATLTAPGAPRVLPAGQPPVGGCRFRGPWGRDVAAAVAVAGHRDAGCAGEDDPVVGESPPLVAEATPEFLHRQPGSARVLGAYPAHQPAPCEVVDRVEHGLGHPVPKVIRPSPVLSGCKTGIGRDPAERAGRGWVSSSPTMVRVLHMLQVRRGQASEQRRQRAPHMAEVLQKLSVKRFTATSCNRPGTPGEPARDLFTSASSSPRSW